VVKWLAEQDGVSLTAEDNDGWQPIHGACSNGHLEVVKWLAKQDGVSLMDQDQEDWQPIHYACDNGHLELVKWLADEGGVSLTAEDNGGWQPIHIACDNGHLEVAKWLAEQDGVSIDTSIPCDNIPYDRARLGHTNMPERKYKGWTPLHVAAEKNHADVVSWLLEAKADVNLKNLKGRTALHVACRNAHEGVLRALVHAGADIQAQDKRRCTPLHSVSVPSCKAAAAGVVFESESSVKRKMCAEMLLGARADPDAANCYGERPLHWSVKHGHPEVAKVLLEHGAATNLRSRNRQTPLELCQQLAVENAQSGDSDLFQELLDILKHAAKDRPAGFSTELLQKHEQSPQGAFYPMLVEVVGPNVSAPVGPKRDDARSVTSGFEALRLRWWVSRVMTRAASPAQLRGFGGYNKVCSELWSLYSAKRL
jgi:ankyrin repeat protein